MTQRNTNFAGVAVAFGPGRQMWKALEGLWRKVSIQRKAREMKLHETLVLGEKRFLAVVEWQSEKFLIGVTPQQITMLGNRRDLTSDIPDMTGEPRQ